MIENLYNEKVYIEYKQNPSNENFMNLISYICENIQNINLSNSNNINLCEGVTKYLFNQKIGKWTYQEAKFIVFYLSKGFAKSLQLNNALAISFLNEEEHKEKFGNTNVAMCTNLGNSTFEVSYSPKVISNLMSNNPNEFLRGLRTLFHEVVHVIQNSFIEKENNNEYDYTKSMYMMAIETIVRHADKNFYKQNYLNLYKENHAEKIGLQKAVETIKKYNDKLYSLYNNSIIQEMLTDYDQKMQMDEDIITYDQKYTKVIEQLELICTLKIKDNVQYLDKYPILRLAYNDDGTKKNIIQLYKERNELLSKGCDKTKIDDLYEVIANRKYFAKKTDNGYKDTTKEEIEELVEYIQNNKIEDEFLGKLLIYRLKKFKNFDNDKIAYFLSLLGYSYERLETTENKKTK